MPAGVMYDKAGNPNRASNVVAEVLDEEPPRGNITYVVDDEIRPGRLPTDPRYLQAFFFEPVCEPPFLHPLPSQPS